MTVYGKLQLMKLKNEKETIKDQVDYDGLIQKVVDLI